MKKFGICLALAMVMAFPANVSAASGVTAEAYYEDIADSLGFKGDAVEALTDAYIIEDADEFPIDGGEYLTRADVAVLANRVRRYTKEREFVDTLTQWFDEDYAELWVEYLRRAELVYPEETAVSSTNFDTEIVKVYPNIAYGLYLKFESEEDEKFLDLCYDSTHINPNTYVTEEDFEKYATDPVYAIFAVPRAYGDGAWFLNMKEFESVDNGVYLWLIDTGKDGGYYRYMYEPIVGDLYLKEAMRSLGYVTDLAEIEEDYQDEVLFALARGYFKGYKDGDGIEFRGENNITVKGAANVLAMAVGEKDMAVVWNFDSIMKDYFDSKIDTYVEAAYDDIEHTYSRSYPELVEKAAEFPMYIDFSLSNCYRIVTDEGYGYYDYGILYDTDGDGVGDSFATGLNNIRESVPFFEYVVQR